MHKQLARFSCAMLLVFVPLVVHAQFKVGVVYIQKAILECEEAKSMASRIEGELKPQADDITDLQAEITAIEEKLVKDADILSIEVQRVHAQQIESKRLDLKHKVEKFEAERTAATRGIFEAIEPKFQAVMQDLVALEGYDMVYSYDPRLMIHVNPKHDITRRVTEELNKRQTSG